jgi:hypothetical protein
MIFVYHGSWEEAFRSNHNNDSQTNNNLKDQSSMEAVSEQQQQPHPWSELDFSQESYSSLLLWNIPRGGGRDTQDCMATTLPSSSSINDFTSSPPARSDGLILHGFLRSLLEQNPVATLPASDGVPLSQFDIGSTISAYVRDGLYGGRWRCIPSLVCGYDSCLPCAFLNFLARHCDVSKLELSGVGSVRAVR